jgi:hypothetical protein
LDSGDRVAAAGRLHTCATCLVGHGTLDCGSWGAAVVVPEQWHAIQTTLLMERKEVRKVKTWPQLIYGAH